MVAVFKPEQLNDPSVKYFSVQFFAGLQKFQLLDNVPHRSAMSRLTPLDNVQVRKRNIKDYQRVLIRLISILAGILWTVNVTSEMF